VKQVLITLLAGFLLGFLFTATLIVTTFGSTMLDTCAKTHNVYQCEMVAVPKSGKK